MENQDIRELKRQFAGFLAKVYRNFCLEKQCDIDTVLRILSTEIKLEIERNKG